MIEQTMKRNMKVRFWGVRGSYPVAGESALHYGGNTACVEIQAGEHTIILDGGSGMIGLGKDLAIRAHQSGEAINATIFFSHLHHDHTQGLPFFVPAFIPSTRLRLFAPGFYEQSPQAVLEAVISPPVFPLRLVEFKAALEINPLLDGQAVQWGSLNPTGRVLHAGEKPGMLSEVVVRAMRSYAHPGGVLVYRVEWGGRSVVYATDVEGYVGVDQRLAAFAKGADLLIHDAQYSQAHYEGKRAGNPVTQGFGHSTPEMASAVAQAAGARSLALFHYDPGYNDQAVAELERSASQIFPGAYAAREGQEILLEALQPELLEKHPVQLRADGPQPHDTSDLIGRRLSL